jgi:hypothetical protein
MSVDERRVEELAYQIWESEGRPHGHATRHWEMASKLAESEASSGKKATLPKPRKPKAAALTDVSSEPGQKKGAGKSKVEQASSAEPAKETKETEKASAATASETPAKKPASTRKPAAKKAPTSAAKTTPTPSKG